MRHNQSFYVGTIKRAYHLQIKTQFFSTLPKVKVANSSPFINLLSKNFHDGLFKKKLKFCSHSSLDSVLYKILPSSRNPSIPFATEQTAFVLKPSLISVRVFRSIFFLYNVNSPDFICRFFLVSDIEREKESEETGLDQDAQQVAKLDFTKNTSVITVQWRKTWVRDTGRIRVMIIFHGAFMWYYTSVTLMVKTSR